MGKIFSNLKLIDSLYEMSNLLVYLCKFDICSLIKSYPDVFCFILLF